MSPEKFKRKKQNLEKNKTDFIGPYKRFGKISVVSTAVFLC